MEALFRQKFRSHDRSRECRNNTTTVVPMTSWQIITSNMTRVMRR